jgi:cation diffusion facilitator family transporter
MLYSFFLMTKAPDKEHPYGHGRAESILAVVVSSLIISMGILVIYEAAGKVSDPEIDADLGTVYLMLAFGCVKLAMSGFAFAIYKKSKSDAIKADAWNHLSDFLISAFIALGVFITVVLPDYRILDPLFAIGIGIFVIITGIKLVLGSGGKLMGSPDEGTMKRISELASKVPGVIDVHNIQVHEYGSSKYVSFHIHVPGNMAAGDAHVISEKVEKCIEDNLHTRPIVHVDPAHDYCQQCELDQITAVVRSFAQVVSVHRVELLHTKSGAMVDMHVVIDSRMSVKQGHDLVHAIMKAIQKKYPGHRADIHLEPCKGDCKTCIEECEKAQKKS